VLTQRTIREVEAGFASAVVTAMGEEGDLVAIRLARGCRCFAAWSGEEVLAYGWLSSGPEWIGELGREIRPAAGEAYLWNCFTLAGQRRQGHFRSLVRTIAALVRDEGCKRLWIGGIQGTAEAALAQVGYQPVLHIAASGDNRFVVAPAAGVDPELLAAGRRALSLEESWSFEAGPPRRH